jgi:hypothetical protein
LEFKQRLITGYDGLFGGGSNGNEYSLEAQFGGKWGWYHSIYTIAKGDLTRFDAVTELPVRQCLTYLMYEKEKNDVEIARLKK